MITKAMKTRLRERGFTEGEIANITPEEVHETLGDKRDINDVHREDGVDAARAMHDSAKPFNSAEPPDRGAPPSSRSKITRTNYADASSRRGFTTRVSLAEVDGWLFLSAPGGHAGPIPGTVTAGPYIRVKTRILLLGAYVSFRQLRTYRRISLRLSAKSAHWSHPSLNSIAGD